MKVNFFKDMSIFKRMKFFVYSKIYGDMVSEAEQRAIDDLTKIYDDLNDNFVPTEIRIGVTPVGCPYDIVLIPKDRTQVIVHYMKFWTSNEKDGLMGMKYIPYTFGDIIKGKK